MGESNFVLKRKIEQDSGGITFDDEVITTFVLVRKTLVSGESDSSGSWDDGSSSGRDEGGRGSDSYTIKKYVLKRKKSPVFQQPILSSNGTLGGDSFAVSGREDLWKAFDGVSGVSFSVTFGNSVTFTIYNPNPIKISEINIQESGKLNVEEGSSVQGSNDNINWTTISMTDNLNGVYTLNNTNFYKYYKFYIEPSRLNIGEITITATEGSSNNAWDSGGEDDYSGHHDDGSFGDNGSGYDDGFDNIPDTWEDP